MALNAAASNEASVASLESVNRPVVRMRCGDDEVKKPSGKRKPDFEALRKTFSSCAGKSSDRLMTEHDRAMKVAKDALRQYNASAERDRSLHYNSIQIKDHAFYNKKDALWNEPQRLEPNKFARYSEQNINPETTFKQQITDLAAIERNEKERVLDEKARRLMKVKQEDA